VLQQEKQLAKTFDIKQDQFVFLKGKVDLEALEKSRYIMSQFNLVNSRITRLTKMLSDGTFELSQEDMKKKITELDGRVAKLDLRTDLFGIMVNDSRQEVSNITASSPQLASIPETEKVGLKISDIEKKHRILSVSKTKNIIVDLIETVEILNNRAKNIEIAFNNIREVNWGKKIESAKKALEKPIKSDGSDIAWVGISESLKKLKQNNKK
jgi:hypothetical protein